MKHFLIFIALFASLFIVSCSNDSNEPTNPQDNKSKIIGCWVAENVHIYDDEYSEKISTLGIKFCENGKIITKEESKYRDKQNGQWEYTSDYSEDEIFWYIGQDGEIWLLNKTIDKDDEDECEVRYIADITFINENRIKWNLPIGIECTFIRVSQKHFDCI